MGKEQDVKPDSDEQMQPAEQAETATGTGAEPVLGVEGQATEEGAAAAAEDLAVLRQELGESRAKEAEYLDGWQRARAELANARKRFQREQQQSYTNAQADLLARLLPVVDDLERAFETLPESLSSHSWVEGIRLVQCKAQGLLAQSGVAPIDAVGHEFDPLLHQAVTHEPSDEVPEGYVIAQMQRGYSLGERVLRPCMVRVSAGPLSKPGQAEEPVPEEQISDAAGEAASTEKS